MPRASSKALETKAGKASETKAGGTKAGGAKAVPTPVAVDARVEARGHAREAKPEAVPCEHEAHGRVPPKPAASGLVIEQAAALFRALGDSARLSLLARLSHGEYCVTELAAASGEGLSTVSQRLRTLRAERLLRRRRVGKHVYYTLADEHVALLIQSALAHASE